MARTLAIGDIHGCLTALTTLAGFAEIRDDDRLITLGDYVDRGPDSAGVLDWVIERFDRGQLKPLRGNHEIMMLDGLRGGIWSRGWLIYGGAETLDSYAIRGLSGTIEDIPVRHRAFIQDDCLSYYETDTHIFVHATLEPDLHLEDQPDETLFWDKWDNPPKHRSGRTMICGHTAQRTGWPVSNGHSVCIDTRVYGDSGWLTCLDVDSREFWQASNQGATRRGHLDDLQAGLH